MSMEGLRQGAQNINSGKGKGGKGNTRASYYARWKPPQMTDVLNKFLAAPPAEESYLGVAEPIVIIKGQYPDLFIRNPDGTAPNPPPITEAHRFRAHTFSVFVQPKKPGQKGFQSFREIVCSAGPEPHAPQNCVGCYQVDHGADAKARDQWAFNIAHLGYYHSHPLVKDGQIQTKKGSNEPVMVKDECLAYKMENILLGRAAQARVQNVRQPKQCESCGQNHPYLFGDHRVLQVGFGHLQNLLDLDTELGKKCMNCNTQILRMAFHCGNEACNAPIIQISQSGWTNEQADQFSKTVYQCGTCGMAGLPYSDYKCGFNEQYIPIQGAGCPEGTEPAKMTIFDCVLWVQREGEKMKSQIVVKKIEPIANFKAHDGRSLVEHLPEIVKAPYNLSEMYSADSLEEQAKTLSIQNPYMQQPAYQPYAGMPPIPGQPTPSQQVGGYPQQVFQHPGFQSPVAQQPVTQYPNMPIPGRPNFGK